MTQDTQPKQQLDLATSQTVIKDCRARFWSQVVIPLLIAEEHFYEVWDMCEERNMIRFQRKKWLKETKKSFDKFHAWLNKGDTRMRNLICDYGTQMSKMTGRQIRSLYCTFRIYFERHDLNDLDFKAEVQVAVSFIHLAKDLFDAYFDLYRENFGIDLRNDYLPARIVEAEMNFERFAEDIIQPTKYNLHPCQNYASVKAYEEFCDKLLNEKTLDEASIKALEFNHEDEFLAKIERERLGMDRLKDKFKVVSG